MLYLHMDMFPGKKYELPMELNTVYLRDAFIYSVTISTKVMPHQWILKVKQSLYRPGVAQRFPGS